MGEQVVIVGCLAQPTSGGGLPCLVTVELSTFLIGRSNAHSSGRG